MSSENHWFWWCRVCGVNSAPCSPARRTRETSSSRPAKWPGMFASRPADSPEGAAPQRLRQQEAHPPHFLFRRDAVVCRAENGAADRVVPDQGDDVHRHRRRLEGVQPLGERRPSPREVEAPRLLYLLEICPIDYRCQAGTAVSADEGGYSLHDQVFRLRAVCDRQVGVAVAVDETGARHQAGPVYRLRGLAADSSDDGDAFAVHADICLERRSAGSVDHRRIANQKIQSFSHTLSSCFRAHSANFDIRCQI